LYTTLIVPPAAPSRVIALAVTERGSIFQRYFGFLGKIEYAKSTVENWAREDAR
jgi:hypothetical protein